MESRSEFSAPKAARRVLRRAATGALATLDRNGAPFASLVTAATTPAGEPILLISRLAVHTRNLERNPQASLLVVGPGGEGGDPLAGARLSLKGAVGPRDDDPMLRRRFLAVHPEAAGYADFSDFSFRRFTVAGGHLVAGFGRIVDLTAEEILTDVGQAGDLIAAEESAVAHMNDDHAQALALYATRFGGFPDGDWTMTGVDPDGIDLRSGETRARVDFAEPVTTGADLRRVLADMARKARAA
jgi:putative heme iron utilization protein